LQEKSAANPAAPSDLTGHLLRGDVEGDRQLAEFCGGAMSFQASRFDALRSIGSRPGIGARKTTAPADGEDPPQVRPPKASIDIAAIPA
jgi:hypothetical protein